MNTLIRPRFVMTTIGVATTILRDDTDTRSYGVELVLCDITGHHRLRSLGGLTPTQARDLAHQLTEAAAHADNYSGPIDTRQECA